MAKAFSITEVWYSEDGTIDPFTSGTGYPERFEWTASEKSIPRGELEWAVEQRTVREDIGDEVCEQLLGSSFDGDLTFSGIWDDRFMGAGRALDTLFALEAMVARGAFVEVKFGRLTWYGVLKKAKFRYKRDPRSGYEISISPHSRERGQTLSKRTTAATGQQRPADEYLRAAEATAALAEQIMSEAPRINMTGTHAAEMTEFVADMLVAVERTRAAVEVITAAASERQAEANLRGANAFNWMRSTALGVTEALMIREPYEMVAWDNAIGYMEIVAWECEQTENSLRLALESDNAYRELSRRGIPKSRRPHRTRSQESLYAISYQYFGTTDHANTIAEYNNLSTLTVPADTLLIIPEAV